MTGRRQARREQLRRQMLDAVEQVLDQDHSFADVSIAQLAATAGVSRPTFYAYFPTKGELLHARFAEVVAELHGATELWWAIDKPPTRERVREALAHIVETYRPHAPLMAAIDSQGNYDPDIRDVADAMMTRGASDLQTHIEAGQAAGFVDRSLSPAEIAAWLMWMGERAHNQILRTATPEDVAAHVDVYTEIVYKTLYQ